MKSVKWMLERFDFGTKHYLKVGETTIGRNKSADIVTTSRICSRQHCVLTLNPDDTVFITNKSTQNGTYVNKEKIDVRCDLKHNDVIGLGCGEFFSDENCKKEEIYVFRLIKMTDVPDTSVPIEISDDDGDDDGENRIELIIPNELAKMEPAQNATVANQLVTNSSPEQNEEMPPASSAANDISMNPTEIDENQEDNELIYSQQLLMEIKKEVSYSEEVITHDDDFTICISDESCDGDKLSQLWADKLSQDQDFVTKKIMESAQNKKRKLTKPIEAMPLIPPKRARRNSTSSNTASTSKKVNKTPTVEAAVATATPSIETASKKPTLVKNELISKNKSSASNGDSIISTAQSSNASIGPAIRNAQNKYVDRLDPYVKTVKKTEKPKTFEDALAKNSVEPKKVRIPQRSKPATVHGQLMSILRQTNGTWPSELEPNVKARKPRRRVHFSEEPHSIREYEPKDDEDGEIIIATKPTHARVAQVDQSNSFENDPLHEIITDITEWKPEWLTERNKTPPINGVNLIVYPLTDVYVSFENYKDTVTPLLKHELWSSIQADNRARNSFEVKITSINLEKRASRRRYIFHLQVVVESNVSRANVGEFVVVKGDGNLSFFAYITNQRFIRSGFSKATYLTMEASESVVKSKDIENKSLNITPIANIRAELKLFNAVFYLDRTPLKSLILNPIAYNEPTLPNRIPKFKYTGYDHLNDEQMEILKSIYNKSVNSSTSLSLIEGPPGTGKTRLIISLILQLMFGQEMKQKLRILVLASSNAAVDIIAKRLVHIREKMESEAKKNMMSVVRYGVLNSMDPDVRQIASQNLKNNQPQSPSAQSDKKKQMICEQNRLRQQIEDLSRKEGAKMTVIQDQIKCLEKRLNQIKETIERCAVTETSEFDSTYQVMANARVICSTLSSSINLKQYIRYFDVCIIDEASQCTEPWSLVPLQYQIKNLILVGDSNQLSPVVLSPVCREYNFERSLFTRLFDSIPKTETYDGKNTYAMTVQYRMHPEICSFVNSYFYNRLTSAPSTVKMCQDFPLHTYRLFELNSLQSNNDAINFCNAKEADFICTMLKVMTKHAKPEEYSYGIITPYAKQRTEIQNRLANSNELSKHKIPVNTIDSYQGQEKDIIILCTTRTTGIGFLANPQRLNVALTRAKKCSIICGNFASISTVRVWRELIDDAKRRKKHFDIPDGYNFQTIADLLVIKRNPNPKLKPKLQPKSYNSTKRQ